MAMFGGKTARSARWVTALSLTLGVAVAGRLSAEPIPTDPQAPSNLEDSDKDIPEIKEAVELFSKRDVAGAMAKIEEAIKKHPELPPAKVVLAQLYFRANQAQAGRIALEQAAQENPNNPAALLNIGQIALNEMRVYEAGMVFDKAREIAAAFEGPEEAKKEMTLLSLSGSAQVAEARQEWEKAKALYEEGLKLDDKNFQLRQRLGRVLFELDDQKAAFAEFQKAAEASEEVTPPGVYMGRLFQGKDDVEQAKKWMDYALKDPKFGKEARTKLGVAQWLMQTGDFAGARPHFEQALKVKPDDTNIKMALGFDLRFLKDYEGARKIFEELYSANPSNPDVINQLALVLVEQPDKAKQTRAVELGEMNARLNPRNPAVLASLGYIYDKTGRADTAKQRYNDAMQAAGGNLFPDLAYYLATVQAREGRYDNAKRLLEPMLAQKAPFFYREQAQKLLEEVNSKVGATSTTPPATPVSTTPPAGAKP